MTDNLSTWIAISVGATSLISFFASAWMYVNSAQRKRFAAEAEMQEVRASLLQLETEIKSLEKQQSTFSRGIEFQFQTLLTKLSEINTRIDSTTIIRDPKPY
jgi:hypothetical protein